MRVLIVGNLNGQIGAATKIAVARGAKVAQAESIEQGLERLRSGNGADMILIDVGDNIKHLVKSLGDERISVPVIACGFGVKSEDAANAIRAGAKEYMPLPPDEELIAAILESITEERDTIIHASAEMAKALKLADQIAPSDANILLTGESGTGKEVMARYIHGKSKRRNGKFISVNCAAIPENLIESELFGHEKGAFTGAVSRRIGKFEEANGGTLLLDEISEMDIRLQAKLLRAIQEKEIDRVGGKEAVKVDLRIIATSNRDLEAEVKKGDFREDLFYRLNIISLRLPPLRERKDDIKPLAEFFVDKYSKSNGLAVKKISQAAFALLASYRWRGNVRELENTMHRAVLLASGPEITEAAIMLEGPSENAPQAETDKVSNMVGRTVESVEKELILTTLNHCLGNRTHAANILGISIRTLRNKLKQYGADGLLSQEG